MVKEKLVFNKVEYDSWDEVYFTAWCNELKQAGYILDFAREPFSYNTTERLVNKYTEKIVMKTKTKYVDKEQILLKGSKYTPDFVILWSDLAYLKLYDILQCGKKIALPIVAQQEDMQAYSIIEIKPSFDLHNMTRLFLINQNIIWDKFEKYVNLVIINELFEATFTPKTFMKTPTGRAKKINWETRTLAQYLKTFV